MVNKEQIVSSTVSKEPIMSVTESRLREVKLEMEIENKKKEVEIKEMIKDSEYKNYKLHEETYKVTRSLTVAIIIIAIINVFLLVSYVKFYNMSRDYALGALEMEKDYNALKTRIIELENELDK